MSEIAAWERQRNAAGAHIKWMFTTAKARAKMGRAYPEPASLGEPRTKSHNHCAAVLDHTCLLLGVFRKTYARSEVYRF